MVITQRTRIKDMQRIGYYIDLAKVNIIEECMKFPEPVKIAGVTPKPFYNVTFNELAWLWDIQDSKEQAEAIIEIFLFSQMSRMSKARHRSAEKLLPKLPLIDFYNFAGHVQQKVKQAAEQFASMQIDLTEAERQAGYGRPDPNGVKKMIDTFARRQGIPDHEDAGNRSWAVYLFVFQTDIEEANKQRLHSKILQEEAKR